MTQSMYLVYKQYPQLGARVVNGVCAVLTNASTSALAKTNAALACNAFYSQGATNSADVDADNFQGNDNFNAAYFDSFVVVSSAGGVPGSGNGSANGDSYIFPGPNVAPQYADHTIYTPS